MSQHDWSRPPPAGDKNYCTPFSPALKMRFGLPSPGVREASLIAVPGHGVTRIVNGRRYVAQRRGMILVRETLEY